MRQKTTHVQIMVLITAIFLVILKDVYIIAHIYTVFSFETAVDLSMGPKSLWQIILSAVYALQF